MKQIEGVLKSAKTDKYYIILDNNERIEVDKCKYEEVKNNLVYENKFYYKGSFYVEEEK